MLLRRASIAAVFVALIGAAQPADANIIANALRNAGSDLAKGALAQENFAGVNTLLETHERIIDEKVKGWIGTPDIKTLVEHVGVTLDARILGIKEGAGDLVKLARLQVGEVGNELLDKAGNLAQNLVGALSEVAKATLRNADVILRQHESDINSLVEARLAQIDDIVKERIEQIDEVAGRRLGDVDVIASKQRLELERGVIRVAVLIGVIALVVFLLRRLSNRYDELKASDARGPDRTLLLARGLIPLLFKDLSLSAVVAATMVALYTWLPMGASKELDELTARHGRAVDAAVASVDVPRARFHASHLQFLDPEGAPLSDAKAKKVALIRDLTARPTMLLTKAGSARFKDRVNELSRTPLYEHDADVLVLRAVARWKDGTSRLDERDAAILAARALRSGRGRSSLSELGQILLESFLLNPWKVDDATLADLTTTRDLVPPASVDHPFAMALAFVQSMNTLEDSWSTHFAKMVEAHAEGKIAARTSEAQAVVDAWKVFDKALRAQETALGPDALDAFKMNDAVFTHAAWFVNNPKNPKLPPKLEDIGNTPADLLLKLRIAPPRVTWAQRNSLLFAGPARAIVQFTEADRFHAWETATFDFENAIVEAKKTPLDAQTQERVARTSTTLGLFVYDETKKKRVPYVQTLKSKSTDPAIVEAEERLIAVRSSCVMR